MEWEKSDYLSMLQLKLIHVGKIILVLLPSSMSIDKMMSG